MTSQYNLRGAKGKEPARPEEASPTHDPGNLEDTVNRLVADVATHKEALGFAAEAFERFKEEMKLMREEMAESVAMNRPLSDLVKTLQDEVTRLRASNQRLLRTNSASSIQEMISRVDVQRPSTVVTVDHYLDLQNVVEEYLNIKTATMLLEGDVVAWWRRKMLDIENDDCTIRTFDDFRKQLKGYFMPVNTERHAYRLVANLKQIGSLKDYIWEYHKVMLDVLMMPEKDKIHWFIIGLQSWAQPDVERSNLETLEQAYVVAERLADTQRKSYTDTFKAGKKSNHCGKKDDRRDHNRTESVSQKPTERTFFRKDYTVPPREVTCWVCGGKHQARVCPKRVRHTRQILRHKVNYLGEPKQYLVRWVDEDDPTWEYAFRLKRSHPKEVRIYHEAASAEDDEAASAEDDPVGSNLLSWGAVIRPWRRAGPVWAGSGSRIFDIGPNMSELGPARRPVRSRDLPIRIFCRLRHRRRLRSTTEPPSPFRGSAAGPLHRRPFD
ncbi:hypothetical protein EJ110_NYTH44642 [Nymphaea thermarum]|nr:hypothetical protein EJ110_NYTH44642 [Nymphaea thermarum]